MPWTAVGVYVPARFLASAAGGALDGAATGFAGAAFFAAMGFAAGFFVATAFFAVFAPAFFFIFMGALYSSRTAPVKSVTAASRRSRRRGERDVPE